MPDARKCVGPADLEPNSAVGSFLSETAVLNSACQHAERWQARPLPPPTPPAAGLLGPPRIIGIVSRDRIERLDGPTCLNDRLGDR